MGSLIAALERGLSALASVAMILIMAIVVCDVALRYVFNAPLQWAYDLISLYLMAGIFFLALSDAYAHNAHVSVDILLTNATPTARRLSEILSTVVGIVLFSLITWVGTTRAYTHWMADDRMSGLIAWPTWISAALVPIGCGLLVLRLLVRLAGHAASIATGRDIIPAPVPEHASVE
jgi:TRAP-type C4-dicarboxylate transport system permease small subunit